MDGKLRNRRLATMALVLICAAPPCAEAQQFVCWPIVRGDTPSRLARQLTGNSAAVYSLAFQIRDPERQMFVPKSQYHRGLSTHWQACVATGPVRSLPLAYAPLVASAAPAVAPEEPLITSTPLPDTSPPSAGTLDPPAVAMTSRTLTSVPSTFAPSDGWQDAFLLIAKAGSAMLVMLLISAAVAKSLVTHPIPPVMQRAGEAFVVAFARPLVDSSSSVPPIHARLRFSRQAQQLEISIAPGVGRRYPNLVDHRRNVEYDVNRVMRVLGTHFVVSDRLRADGKWVVVPIRLAELNQTGAK
jgi:hypothetical protein